MREQILKLEKNSLMPAFLAALVLFVSLSLIIPPGANVLMSGIVSVAAFPIIFVFCLFGCALLMRFSSQSSWINYLAASTGGIVFGMVGYFTANAIAYFQGTMLAFILSGFVAAIVMQFKITVNKARQNRPTGWTR